MTILSEIGYRKSSNHANDSASGACLQRKKCVGDMVKYE